MIKKIDTENSKLQTCNITYVTGNHAKYLSVKECFEEKGIELEFYNYDFEEPDVNDIEKISRKKVLDAYAILKTPCFVTDTGCYIVGYPNKPGYPGAFVKRSGISTDIEKLLDTMKNETNRTCKFIDCLTFYDGKELYTFYGESKGNLSYNKRGVSQKKAKSNLWYVFIPNNCDKTLAEMTNQERKNRNDSHTSATEIFANWYKENYLNEQKKTV